MEIYEEDEGKNVDYFVFNKNNMKSEKKLYKKIILVYNNTNNSLGYKEIDQRKYRLSLQEKFKISFDDINDNFGFIGLYRKKLLSFKLKEKNNVNNSGKNCSQLGTFNEQMEYINNLNIIQINKKKYHEYNSSYILYKDLIPESINLGDFIPKSFHLCMEIEILLRLFDEIKLNNKRWFFNQIENTIYNCSEFPKKRGQHKYYLN